MRLLRFVLFCVVVFPFIGTGILVRTVWECLLFGWDEGERLVTWLRVE